MNEWFTRFSHTATFGGVGILVVAAMVLVLQLLLPRYDRRLVRGPVLLLFLHLGLIALQLVLPAASGAHRPLQLAAFFVLLVAAGRTAFLLVLHWPSDGDYRVFLQFKRSRLVQTAVFDLRVQAVVGSR